MSKTKDEMIKSLELVRFTPPPAAKRARRNADFAAPDEKKGRYHLPNGLKSASPVGYRTRLGLTEEEADEALQLLSLDRPQAFVPGGDVVTEQELFEENALGVLSARQSTNFKGQRTIILERAASMQVLPILRKLTGLDAPVLDHATHTHVVLSRPYRTPFTTLLTFVGHKPFASLLTVPMRALQKSFRGYDDIPTVGYLQHLHIGVLADQFERAVVVASGGRRKAQVLMQPFTDDNREGNQKCIQHLGTVAGLTPAMRRQGWSVAFVAQVGQVAEQERPDIQPATYRKIGANMLSFRSERILPGVNQEESAPEQYQKPQDMDVPERMTEMAGRAAYNSFTHWTGIDRDLAKEILLLERIESLTDEGEERLGQVRDQLGRVTDFVIDTIPRWIDVPLRGFLTRNAERGRKAFALTGQRIYIGGLDHNMVDAAGLGWNHAIRVAGAASSRAALFAELMGVVELPEDCDLLAGICLMAGPINQNDIGKAFFDQADLLKATHPDIDPTSLLMWTLKAKTVADPIGNEEQLLNAARKGALVDLRPGPHEVVHIRSAQGLVPMRKLGEVVNNERAFSDQNNFVVSVDGREIPGNRGQRWQG